MLKKTKSFLSLILSGLILVSCSDGSTADISNGDTADASWPTGPVTIICPWAVGGLADQANRAMSQYGEEQLGQPLLADNVLGSGGIVALTEYLREEPNTNNLIMGGETNFAVAPLTSEVEYTYEDFIPVINIYSSTFVLTANPNTGIDSFEKFEDYVANNEVKFATNGYNSSEAMQGAALVSEMGGTFEIVPYDGANEALNAVVSGEVDFAITHSSLAREFVKSGDVLPVVAFDEERLVDEVYDLDCVVDHGYDTWMTNICAVFTRAGTDEENVEIMYNALNNILQNPSFLETAENMDLNIDPMTGDEVDAYIESCIIKAEDYIQYLE